MEIMGHFASLVNAYWYTEDSKCLLMSLNNGKKNNGKEYNFLPLLVLQTVFKLV